MENWPYLFAAYTVIWIAVFAYVLLLLQGERKLRREIDSLRRSLKNKSGS